MFLIDSVEKYDTFSVTVGKDSVLVSLRSPSFCILFEWKSPSNFSLLSLSITLLILLRTSSIICSLTSGLGKQDVELQKRLQKPNHDLHFLTWWEAKHQEPISSPRSPFSTDPDYLSSVMIVSTLSHCFHRRLSSHWFGRCDACAPCESRSWSDITCINR